MRRSTAAPRHGSRWIGTIDLVAGDPERHAPRPVLITQHRRALAAAVVAVLVALALGVRYAGDSYPAWLDQVARSLAREWFPMPRGMAMIVIELYDPVPLAIVIAVLAGVCLALRRRHLAVLAVVGPVLTGLATAVMKPVVERTKNGDLSYPSGHMGSAVAIAVVVSLLLFGLIRSRRWAAVVALAVPILWGATVGIAMTVTSYHYWTDAVGGFCLAVAVVLGLAVLIDCRPSRMLGWQARVGRFEQPIFRRDAPTP
jgi:membrane-associated phospholipid phosphatase